MADGELTFKQTEVTGGVESAGGEGASRTGNDPTAISDRQPAHLVDVGGSSTCTSCRRGR